MGLRIDRGMNRDFFESGKLLHGGPMKIWQHLFQRGKQRPVNPVTAACFEDFLYGRDPKALTRSRALVPCYFIAFSLFLRHTSMTNRNAEIVEGLFEKFCEEKIAEEAIIAVDMTLVAVSCASDCVLKMAPTPEDWRALDSHVEQVYLCRDPRLRENYFEFAHSLMASIQAIMSSSNAVINAPVMRLAIMSSALFAKEAAEQGIGFESGWLNIDKEQCDGYDVSPKEALERINNMFWGVVEPLGARLLKDGAPGWQDVSVVLGDSL